jgi:NAD(P)-dependent dehydrogenase (short-subunit alcohol dehydrogenase family)
MPVQPIMKSVIISLKVSKALADETRLRIFQSIATAYHINCSAVTAARGVTPATVSTCKAAVVHLAHILSAELVHRGIRVNTLSPGPTDTAMFGRFPGEEQGEAVKGVLPTNNPSKRMTDPLEIAKLAVYLASDDSAYVVGADFLIDGGVTAISGVGA